jgi:hypothetical protein
MSCSTASRCRALSAAKGSAAVAGDMTDGIQLYKQEYKHTVHLTSCLWQGLIQTASKVCRLFRL